MARGGRRRVLDEEPKAERRQAPAHERDPALSGAEGQVLRLQALAGNTAVSAMMRSAAIQRDEGGGAAPADTKEKPKRSGHKVTVEGLGEFQALSFSQDVIRSPGSRGEGEEGEAPKKQPMKVFVTKEMDELTSRISKAAAQGTSFPTVIIDVGGAKLVLKNVVISSHNVSTGADPPTETVAFDATDAKWEIEGGGEGGY